MKKEAKFQATVSLDDNQKVAIIDSVTGEVIPVNVTKTPKDNKLQYHNKTEQFKKVYPKAWKLLETQTNDKEFLVAYKLGLMAKAYTNSLAPLRPELTNSLLAQELNVDRKQVRKILNKLLKLGVIGKFEVGEQVSDSISEIKKYWIFNPYLSFNGRLIDKDIARLFSNTFYAKMV